MLIATSMVVVATMTITLRHSLVVFRTAFFIASALLPW